MSTPAANFSEREFVIVQVSRLVEDNKIYWVGGGGEPLSSVLLAKRTNMPNLQYLTEDGVVGPEAIVPFDPLMTMISSRANYRALQWSTMNYAADLAHLGYVDYGILATLQVDRYGNVNSTVVGKYEGGEGRRFGGPGGADSIAALAWRTILVTDQQKRKFVDRVDFISSPGFLEGPGSREKHGLPPGTGPWRVYTPWAMFGYDTDCQLMLQAIAPYVTVEQDRLLAVGILDDLASGARKSVGAAEAARGQERQAHRARLQPKRHDRIGVFVDFEAVLTHRARDPRAESDEADIDPVGASGLDQHRAGDVGELAAQPEILFALTDNLAHQRGRAALEVVAVVGEVVAVMDELLDRFRLGHQLGDHLVRLVIAHVGPIAVGIDF